MRVPLKAVLRELDRRGDVRFGDGKRKIEKYFNPIYRAVSDFQFNVEDSDIESIFNSIPDIIKFQMCIGAIQKNVTEAVKLLRKAK